LNLKAALQILRNAIGKTPKDKVIYWLSLSMYYIIFFWNGRLHHQN